MKRKFANVLSVALISLGLLTTANVADAYSHCRWVGGHYDRYHHHIKKHKVCTYSHYRHCKWVGGYTKKGHYVHKHKVCRYNN